MISKFSLLTWPLRHFTRVMSILARIHKGGLNLTHVFINRGLNLTRFLNYPSEQARNMTSYDAVRPWDKSKLPL